uniref:Chitin-binding type-2 domain-containing protein n=1 Tax=Anopheles farauti TaxID=69004 RepID=A0A182Q518_9DIPT
MMACCRSWQIFAGLLVLVAGPRGGDAAVSTGRAIADNALCPVARCETYAEINTLWTVPDPAFYLHCRPDPKGGWYLQQMPCAPGTLFSYRQQVCVRTDLWTGCDGTESDTSTENPLDPQCPLPTCITYKDINTLWKHERTDHFYQCRPRNGAWEPQEMPCAPGTLFSFRSQVCVRQELWQELPAEC